MKNLTALSFFAFLLLGYDVAEACSCKPPPPPAEALKEARAVFAGEVTRVRGPRSIPVRNGRGKVVAYRVTFGAEVRFKVINTWKGVTADVVTVVTVPGCGYGFVEGGRYLVYAYGDGPGLVTGMCSRTKALDAAPEDLSVLGEGKPPLKRAAPTKRRGDSPRRSLTRG
jgi:hypothetical protein